MRLLIFALVLAISYAQTGLYSVGKIGEDTCIENIKIVSEDECMAAATELGGEYVMTLDAEFWETTPFGCFTDENGSEFFFNSNVGGVAHSSKSPICKIIDCIEYFENDVSVCDSAEVYACYVDALGADHEEMPSSFEQCFIDCTDCANDMVSTGKCSLLDEEETIWEFPESCGLNPLHCQNEVDTACNPGEDIDCARCVMDFFEADLCPWALSEAFEEIDSFIPNSCDVQCEDAVVSYCEENYIAFDPVFDPTVDPTAVPFEISDFEMLDPTVDPTEFIDFPEEPEEMLDPTVDPTEFIDFPEEPEEMLDPTMDPTEYVHIWESTEESQTESTEESTDRERATPTPSQTEAPIDETQVTNNGESTQEVQTESTEESTDRERATPTPSQTEAPIDETKAPSTAQVGVASVRFDIPYEETCGSDKQAFLDACTASLDSTKSVQCFDCYAGSTIVTFLGVKEDVVEVATDIIEKVEHVIEGYAPLTVLELIETRPETLNEIFVDGESNLVEVEITSTTTSTSTTTTTTSESTTTTTSTTSLDEVDVGDTRANAVESDEKMEILGMESTIFFIFVGCGVCILGLLCVILNMMCGKAKAEEYGGHEMDLDEEAPSKRTPDTPRNNIQVKGEPGYNRKVMNSEEDLEVFGTTPMGMTAGAEIPEDTLAYSGETSQIEGEEEELEEGLYQSTGMNQDLSEIYHE